MTDDNEVKHVNPNEIYAQILDSWLHYWDDADTLYNNVFNIVTQCVFLPNKNLLAKLLCIYILLPSKWARVVPILFCYGERGTGKSTGSLLASKLHGFNHTFSPADTFASIRNSLDAMRWIDPHTKELEKEGALLPWDNIYGETFIADAKIYQLLLCGYNRSTDKIQIAGSDGNNKDYFVFCPKILSSVEPIHLDSRFTELHRRLIVLPHKKWDKFTDDEKIGYEELDINLDKIDIDSVDWAGFQDVFFQFWNDPFNYSLYASTRKELTRKGKKSFKLPKSMNSERWTISIDLIVTGIVLKAFKDINDALAFFDAYWQFADKEIYADIGASVALLREFIELEVGEAVKINQQLIKSGMTPYPAVLNATKLKEFLATMHNQGRLDINPKLEIIRGIMWEEGWTLKKDGWVQR